MKKSLYVAMCFLFFGADYSLQAEQKEWQLTKEVKVRYELETKEENGKSILLVKNPHLWWLDLSSTVPVLRQEISLDGILTIERDFKGNRIPIESNGKIHITYTPVKDSEPQNMELDGKISFLTVGDVQKILDVFFKSNQEISSKDKVIALLDLIQESSIDMSNVTVNVLENDVARNIFDVESGKIVYRSNSSNTLGEIAMKVKRKILGFSGVASYFKFLNFGPVTDDVSVKLLLPEWKTLKTLVLAKNSAKEVPDFTFNWDFLEKSAQTSQKGTLSIVGKRDQANTFSTQYHWQVEDEKQPGWVHATQTPIVTEAPQNDSQHNVSPFFAGLDKTVHNWLISPKTTPFLLLWPLHTSLDWSGVIDYSTSNDLIKKWNSVFHLLGAPQSGIVVNFNYENSSGVLKINLMNARPVFNRIIGLYNALSDSLPSPILQKFSPEAKDKLFSIFMDYADQPKDKNMTLTTKFSDQEATVGNQDASKLMRDLTDFFDHYFKESQPSERPVEIPAESELQVK